MFSTREINEKIERILELESCGLNIPKMFYVPVMAGENTLIQANSWAKKIFEKNNEQKFNIRTYTWMNQKESNQTRHICDIHFSDLYMKLSLASMDYNCMIDAETPDNGRLAGNVVIVSKNNKPHSCLIEYCKKDKRAMVRDHDKSIEGLLVNSSIGYEPVSKKSFEDPVLIDVLNKALESKIYDKVLEWTWFCSPAGNKNESLVWWEYRKF